MHRRGFLGRLFAAGAISAPTAITAIDADLPDRVRAGAIEARWLGWRHNPWSDQVWGVWLFVSLGPSAGYGYSTTNGRAVRGHRPGAQFDCTVYGDNWITAVNDSPERRQTLRQAAYERGLIEMLRWDRESI